MFYIDGDQKSVFQKYQIWEEFIKSVQNMEE